jgi:lipopolysaccharide/colanic/teichoic acid biosynthesis glycosyltransferase
MYRVLMGTIPLIRQSAAETDWNWHAVSVCERFGAVLLLLLAFPLLLAAGLLVWILSGRTPLIAHRRAGWQGSDLWMLKLRTMWGNGAAAGEWIERIDDEVGPGFKSARDPRVRSRFAQFCRRHSIDELPQLWHVITGEMSLVGPRPMTARELRRHYGADASEILRVRPGLAGLWQISGRNRLTYQERRRLDLQLVRERNLPMYLGILLRTVPEVFSGENTW